MLACINLNIEVVSQLIKYESGKPNNAGETALMISLDLIETNISFMNL